MFGYCNRMSYNQFSSAKLIEYSWTLETNSIYRKKFVLLVGKPQNNGEIVMRNVF